MIAEIEGKLSKSIFDRAERLENQLTGNFFGNLRYLPYDKGLGHILKRLHPKDLNSAFEDINVKEWSDTVEFWKRKETIEPDVYIDFSEINMKIIIEVKLNSPLSSDDDVDNSSKADGQEAIESENQLAKQAVWLAKNAGNNRKFLILLARASDAYEIYANVKARKIIIEDVSFGIITWEDAYDALIALIAIDCLNPYERVIIDDLATLLQKKGFDGFRSFEINDLLVDSQMTWMFDYSNDFSFIPERAIERGLYFEFG